MDEWILHIKHTVSHLPSRQRCSSLEELGNVVNWWRKCDEDGAFKKRQGIALIWIAYPDGRLFLGRDDWWQYHQQAASRSERP